jgi:hypothetical protein
VTDASGTVVPLRHAAPLAPPGYLGLIQKTIEVDWVMAEKYGPPVIVATRSPAWKAGLRSDDFVTTINDQEFQAFHAKMPPAGTQFRIVAYRRSVGIMRTFGVLEPATPRKPKRKPAWTRERSVLAGKPVLKPDRPKYWKLVSRHPFVRRYQWYLTTLVEMDWGRGLYAKHETIAAKANTNKWAVRRAQACCANFGFVRVTSGKRKHKSNYCDVCWPADTR